MAKSEPISVINKLTDVLVDQKSFTNTDNGEIVEYTRLTLQVETPDGEIEQVEFKSAEGKAAYTVLKMAKTVE